MSTLQLLTLVVILLLAVTGIAAVVLRLMRPNRVLPFGEEPDAPGVGEPEPASAEASARALNDYLDMRDAGNNYYVPASAEAPPPDAPTVAATAVDTVAATAATGRLETPAATGNADVVIEAADEPERMIGAPLAFLVLLLLLIGGVWLIRGWYSGRDPERFLITVAPFQDAGSGQVSDSGRAVAQELVQVLNAMPGDQIIAQPLANAPANAEEAARLIAESQSDLLIWGDVRPGELLNAESLRGRLIYRPTGQFAPAAWDGYYGRFSPPRFTEISNQPINGQAVLPPLIESLAAYNDGDFDLAFQQLGELTRNYPALRPALPHSLRAAILWAANDYEQALVEYEQALVGATIEQPYIYNDMAAVLLDANDPRAAAMLQQAQQAAGTAIIPEIQFNLATAALRSDDLPMAYAALEKVPVADRDALVALLTKSAIERGSGNTELAAATMNEARRRLQIEAGLAVDSLLPYTRQRLRSVVEEQEVLLDLARLPSPPRSGHLEWDLEAAGPQDPGQLRRLVNRFDSIIVAGENLVREWRELSSSAEAAGDPIRGRVAGGQAVRVERAVDRQRYYQALLLIEESREGLPRTPSFVADLLDSLFGTPVGNAINILQNRITNTAINPDAQIQLGRGFYLLSSRESASAAFSRATELAAQRPEPFYGQALIALDEGRRDEARSLLAQSIVLDPGFFPARKMLAQLALDDNNLAAAAEQQQWLADYYQDEASRLALATTLRRMGPENYGRAEEILLPMVVGNRDAQIELGRLYRAANRPVEAETWLARAAAATPALAEASYQYGQFLESQGRFQEAEAQYERALGADNSHVSARVALANLYAGPLNRPGDAVTQFSTALNAEVRDPEQLVRAGDALLQFDQPEQAIDAYNRALQIRPDDPLVYHKVAQAYLALDQIADARSYEQQALDRSGNALAPALAGMGEIERRQGNYAGARSLFNQALGRDGNLVEGHIGLGRTTADEQNWSVALSHFQNAVVLQPSNPLAHFWRAEALLRQPTPQPSEALISYNQALQLRPNFPEAVFGTAQAYRALEQHDAAGLQLQRAIELRPGYAEALLLRGKIAQELGRNQDALADYNAAINSNDRIPEAYYRRALLEIQNEDYRAARRDLQSVTTMQNNFPEAHYWLGRIYFIDGEFQAARDSFDRALQLQPNFADAQAFRDQAQQRLEAQGAT